MAAFQPHKGKTIYIGKGDLPASAIAHITLAKAGEVVLTAQCDKGAMTVIIDVNSTRRTAPFVCTSEHAQEAPLGSVNKGDKLHIDADGADGAQYAITLEYR